MYAITFDLDTERLKELYPTPSWNNAYNDIGRVLNDYGFIRQQGSVYFGDTDVTPVTCSIVAQELEEVYSWFVPCVRDIRMLRIEENNDLSMAFRANKKKLRKDKLRVA